jgi:hypothetical protein
MAIVSHASSLRYINRYNFTTKQASTTSSSPSSAQGSRDSRPSLALVRRDEVTGSTYPSLRHAVLDLVARDNARAEYLATRLSPAYQPPGFSGSESKVVSGLDEGSGEYLVRVSVGSPPTEQYLVVDSGSDVMWVQCKPCLECYVQADPLFDPATSATFSSVSCGSAICRILRTSACGDGDSGGCEYKVSYADGSYYVELLLRRPVRDRGRRREAAAAGWPVPADRGRRWRRCDGHGHHRDAAAAGGVRGSAGRVRGSPGGRGPARAGRVVVGAGHVLRPERVRKRACAHRVLLLRRRRQADSGGEERAAGGGHGHILPGVRAVVVGSVHHGKHPAGRDSDHRRLGQRVHWFWTCQLRLDQMDVLSSCLKPRESVKKQIYG